MKLKGKFIGRSIVLHGSECQATKQHVQKLSAAKMRMLKWMSGNTLKDRIKNEYISRSWRLLLLRIK